MVSRFKVRHGFLLAACFLAACNEANFVIHTVSGVPLQPGDVAFIQPGKTTLAEVREVLDRKAGSPYWQWDRPRAFAYEWSQTASGPTRGPQIRFKIAEPIRFGAFVLVFDSSGKVVRTQFLEDGGLFLTEGDRARLKEKVEAWLGPGNP